ncbi:hypothetical protein DRO57_04825 [Candidatus Bathyarchaeota archaeon]|nr:MAG: hypothetical protein DRO57_04825 [Candidatus Bathyarchaeota archaeon]
MNPRERIMAALTWGWPDYVPWAVKPNHLPRGTWERVLRNMGLGLTIEQSVYRIEMHGVEVLERRAGNHVERTYRTPVGEVSEVVRINLPSEAGERGGSWKVKGLIDRPEDYDVLLYIIDHMVVKPDYEDFHVIDEELGVDGVVLTNVGYSPFMKLLVEYMGFRKLVVELNRRPGKVEEVLQALHRKTLEACRIVADSPARLVLVGDNIDENLVNPRFFEKYCLPYYREYTRILHSKGKVVGSHMDGRLRNLAELIAESGFDFIHGFTPPPTGNLSIRDARRLWDRDIAIWVNIPETLFYEEPEVIERSVRSFLRESAPGDGFMLGITETVPPWRRRIGYETVMRTVLKHGRLPVKL